MWIGVSAVLFVVLVIFISSFSMVDEAYLHDGHIPDNIGAYFLTHKIEGEEAKEILYGIVGEVELENAYVLEYQTNQGAYAVVWISEAKNNQVPLQLFEEMKAYIEENNLYAQHKGKEFSNIPVQYGSGMDRDNYYFAKNDRFVLIATYDEKSQRFIKNAVKIF